MTTNYRIAPIASLRLHGNGQDRFTVRCPHCCQIHSHRWFGNHVAFDATAPCSVGKDIRMYRVDLSAALERDSNAIDEPVPNWTE